MKSSLPIVEYLVEQCGLYIDATDKNNDTPLLLSLTSNQNDIAKYLINNGADVNAQGSGGNTALHIACELFNSEIIGQLLKRADIDVNARNEEDKPPIHLLFPDKYYYYGLRGNPKLKAIAKMLLDHGADFDALDNNGHKPFKSVHSIFH